MAEDRLEEIERRLAEATSLEQVQDAIEWLVSALKSARAEIADLQNQLASADTRIRELESFINTIHDTM